MDFFRIQFESNGKYFSDKNMTRMQTIIWSNFFSWFWIWLQEIIRRTRTLYMTKNLSRSTYAKADQNWHSTAFYGCPRIFEIVNFPDLKWLVATVIMKIKRSMNYKIFQRRQVHPKFSPERKISRMHNVNFTRNFYGKILGIQTSVPASNNRRLSDDNNFRR